MKEAAHASPANAPLPYLATAKRRLQRKVYHRFRSHATELRATGFVLRLQTLSGDCRTRVQSRITLKGPIGGEEY